MNDSPITIQSNCEKIIKSQGGSWWAMIVFLAIIWLCISAIICAFAGLWILIF
jgi:hypothetical protein